MQKLPRWVGGLDIFGVEVDHVARREGWHRGAAAVVVLCHVIFCFSQRRLSFLKGILHPIHKLVNHFNVGWRLMQFKAHLGVSAGIEEEECLLHGGVDMVVVGQLRQGEECVPIVLSFSNKDPQVLFQFLVDPFYLSISLWVVGSRCHGFDSQQLVQLLHEGSNELQSVVGHNLPWEAMELPDVPKVEVCCSSGSDW